jgi:homoserine dehydrogenase
LEIFVLGGKRRESKRMDYSQKPWKKGKGLAETDPTLDIQKIDAAHKLIIMMNIAFGGAFDFTQLYTEAKKTPDII